MQDFEILCNLNIWTLIFPFFIIFKFDCNLKSVDIAENGLFLLLIGNWLASKLK